MCLTLTQNGFIKKTGAKMTEWDALIEGVFDAAQHFVSEYDFSVAND
jgi:hypothetical protein